MPKTAHPTGERLVRFLLAAGVISDPPSDEEGFDDYDDFVAAAVADFEDLTGRTPFLVEADADPVTRKFTPPGPRPVGSRYGGGRRLELDNGLYSVTSVTIGVTATSDGTVLTLGTDYWLCPSNSPTRSQPYEWIEFRNPVYGEKDSIEVAGLWGWWITIPDQVYEGILMGAASRALTGIGTRTGGGIKKIAFMAASLESTGELQFDATRNIWNKRFQDTAENFKLNIIGVNE